MTAPGGDDEPDSDSARDLKIIGIDGDVLVLEGEFPMAGKGLRWRVATATGRNATLDTFK